MSTLSQYLSNKEDARMAILMLSIGRALFISLFLLELRMLFIFSGISYLSESTYQNLPEVSHKHAHITLSDDHSVFELLYSIMSTNEIKMFMAESAHPNVRSYGVWALSRRGEKADILNIIEREASYSENIHFSVPCSSYDKNSMEFMIDVISFESYVFQSDINLTKQDFSTLGIPLSNYDEIVNQEVYLKGKACCNEIFLRIKGISTVVKYSVTKAYSFINMML